jgi:hypothetical protein
LEEKKLIYRLHPYEKKIAKAMTTFTCEICCEEKTLGEMTLCGNGHFGGCQKCHMEVVKAKYKSETNVYRGGYIQQCMFCREHLKDSQMGNNWAIKLHKLQPIMMASSPKIKENMERTSMTLHKLVKIYNDSTYDPEPLNYDLLEKFMASQSFGLSQEQRIKFICKIVGDSATNSIIGDFTDLSKRIREAGGR